MPADSPTEIPTCVDPARCAVCPPDRVCAWACEQGWGVNDILVEITLIEAGKLPPPESVDEAVQCVRQAMWERFNS
jgi:hypothetical protein